MSTNVKPSDAPRAPDIRVFVLEAPVHKTDSLLGKARVLSQIAERFVSAGFIRESQIREYRCPSDRGEAESLVLDLYLKSQEYLTEEPLRKEIAWATTLAEHYLPCRVKMNEDCRLAAYLAEEQTLNKGYAYYLNLIQQVKSDCPPDSIKNAINRLAFNSKITASKMHEKICTAFKSSERFLEKARYLAQIASELEKSCLI